MSKINVLAEFLKNPKGIITEGYQALARKKHTVDYEKLVATKFGKKQLPTIDLMDLCPGLTDTVERYSFLPNTSLITDILLLRGLAKKFNPCSYLEIGSYRGESIAAVSDVADNCTSITLSADEMKAFGMSDDAVKIHGVYSKDKKNITTYLHNSLTFDYNKLGKKYDLLFVDGDHEHDSVVIDTQNVFKLLKDDNSIIVWHDYGFDAETVRHEVLAAILEGTPKEYHSNLYHVSNTMCAVFIRGKFNTTLTKRYQYPDKTFKVSVETSRL